MSENISIYPKLDLEVITSNEVETLNHKIDVQKIKINQNRINNFLLEKKQLDDLLVHYRKLKHKWTCVDSGLKVFLVTSGGILSVSSVVITGVATLG